MEGLEIKSFEIISTTGAAKSNYIEAIQLAAEGMYEEAERKVEEGTNIFIEGHRSHAELIQKEASGDSITMNLLLTHAEDQLMSAEIFKVMANEMIRLHKKLGELSEKVN